MNDLIAPSTIGQHQIADAMDSPSEAVPSLPPHRRPRVREVSSRFMSSLVSPSTSSSSPSDLHHPPPKSPLLKLDRSKSVTQRRRQEPEEPLSRADENIPDTIRRSFESAPHSNKAVMASAQRKQLPRPAVKVKLLLKENEGRAELQHLSDSVSQQSKLIGSRRGGTGNGNGNFTTFRSDTPMTVNNGENRIVSSRFRNNISTAAAKLLQSATSTKETCENAERDSKFLGEIPNLRSSMPETSVGSDAIGSDSSKFSASPCFRSLNLPLSSSCDGTPYVLSKSFVNSVKTSTGSLCLPPLPGAKAGTDSRRERKASSHQEQVHSLKMLHNHYLQWRLANAKAEASMRSQRSETERKLYSLGVQISDLRNAVKRKHAELGLLKRAQTLSTVLEAHMPYLDEWSTLEGEYSSYLSGAIHALHNASIRLPVSGNVQVNVREVEEALNSAVNMTETIVFHLQRFMPKAEEMDAFISELARVNGGERAFIEECGHLLFKTYTSQVEECCLRGHLIQLHQSNHTQAQEK